MAYLNIVEAESALGALAAGYPGLCERIFLPEKSVEGRVASALRIGKDRSRKALLVTGGVHAREWGSVEIALYFAADLLEAYQLGTGLEYGGRRFTKATIRRLLEEFQVFVFPQVNPDGRYHSQAFVPMWRKNRNPSESHGQRGCVGVDLNRNHDFLWDFPVYFSSAADVATSGDPCDPSQTYRGKSPASEPETRNVAWLLDNHPLITWLVDLHSYGRLVMYPWGDDENQTTDKQMSFRNPSWNGHRGTAGESGYREYIPSRDLATFKALAKETAEAIKAVRGEEYTPQQGFALYPTSGAVDDWAYARHRVDANLPKVWAYTIEWGDEFQPPWNEMERIVADISAGLVAFASGARRRS